MSKEHLEDLVVGQGKTLKLVLKIICIIRNNNHLCQSRWPRGLRRGFAAARLLGLRVLIPLGAWMSVFLSVVCSRVTGSDRLLIQRSLTKR